MTHADCNRSVSLSRSAPLFRLGAKLGALGLSALLVAACAAPTDGDEAVASAEVGATSSALAPDSYAWGFAWVNPTSSIHPAYSYNSGGGTNTYSGSNGIYTVSMPQLGLAGGNVQVVAYGESATRCKVSSWGPSGTTLNIGVRCHDTAGVNVASPFVVFFNKGAAGQSGAHVYYSGISAPASYSWNSTGGTNTVTAGSTGYYTVNLPGINYANAGVHVTAYGSDAKYCKIVSWGTSGSNANVSVRCNDGAGNPANSAFSLTYSSGAPRSGVVGGHAWVDGPTSVPLAYQKVTHEISCFTAANATASSSAVLYPDTFSGPQYGFATMGIVTAYGNDSSFCNVRYWGQEASGYRVTPKCFTPTGTTTTTKQTSGVLVATYPGPC